MRRWGVLITAFYVLILAFFILPGLIYLWGDEVPSTIEIARGLFDPRAFLEGGWAVWVGIAIFATAQALLLFVSVDTTRKRLLPRRRVAVSVATITFAVGLLTAAVLWSVLVAYLGEDDNFFDSWLTMLLTPLTFWVLWGIVFYSYRDRISAHLDKAVNWLVAGSILELLIVVPCHIIIRQRGDCSAPIVTAFGIATGISVMLMAFGPCVFFLYQKRLRSYKEPIPKRGS